MADLLASSPINTAAPTALPEGDENAQCTPMRLNSTSFKDINETKAELLARVQSLRKDLKDWRGKLDNQVHVYRQELGELRSTLNVEVEQLKTDFQELRLSLKKQLDVTSNLSDMKLSSPSPLKPKQEIEDDEPNVLRKLTMCSSEDDPLTTSSSDSEHASEK